jgi:predicted glycosyltransferase
LGVLFSKKGVKMKLVLNFNGAQTILSQLQPVFSAVGVNTTIIVNTAQTWSTADLTTLERTAGNKGLGLEFNGAQSLLAQLRSVVSSAGTNTTVAINTAQTWSTADLTSLEGTAGSSKKLTLSFNGTQTILSQAQPVVTAAGTNTTVNINTIQGWSTADLVSLVTAAG